MDTEKTLVTLSAAQEIFLIQSAKATSEPQFDRL